MGAAMARRKESGLDLIAGMPWPFGFALGIAAYLGIRYGIGWYFSAHGEPILKGLGAQAYSGIFAPLAWVALALCWIASFVSYTKAKQRRKLFDMQTGLDSLRAMSWREFEMLVGEAFRRDGYFVEESGLAGADGGVDLVLHRGGRKTLVQCKQWRARHVNVSVVREMWGLASHHEADAVKIVCISEFTTDAAAFAAGKPIELITGPDLLSFIRPKQALTPQFAAINAGHGLKTSAVASVKCPRCGTAMVTRSNRKTGEAFWGCQDYPRCRGTRPSPARS